MDEKEWNEVIYTPQFNFIILPLLALVTNTLFCYYYIDINIQSKNDDDEWLMEEGE